MTEFEILASRLAESVLMDWSKEEQVELAAKIAGLVIEKTNNERETAD